MTHIREIFSDANVLSLSSLMHAALSLGDFLEETDRNYQGIAFKTKCSSCRHESTVRTDSRVAAAAHFQTSGWQVRQTIGFASYCSTCIARFEKEQQSKASPSSEDSPIPRITPHQNLTKEQSQWAKAG